MIRSRLVFGSTIRAVLTLGLCVAALFGPYALGEPYQGSKKIYGGDKKKAELKPEEIYKGPSAEDVDKRLAKKTKKPKKVADPETPKLPKPNKKIPQIEPVALGPGEEPKVCKSTEEYKKTLKFLREVKEFDTPEPTARKIADQVSKGCDGASERFAQVFTLAKKIGMSHYKALEVALDFSRLDEDIQRNFFTIFEKTYLSEYFNYSYKVAFEIALSLSKGYHGDPKVARRDFLQLVDFCKSNDSLDLPISFCAKMAVEVAHLSQYFKVGVFTPFRKMYKKMRDDKNFGVSVKDAVKISYSVLKYGPKAPDNFLEGFDYAVSKKGLGLDSPRALRFAMKMAKRSVTHMPPPVVKND